MMPGLSNMGYRRDEFIGRESASFLTKESRAYACFSVLPRFFEAGEARDVPFTFVKKNDETLNVLLTAVSVRNSAGAIVHSVAVLIDITARQRAAEPGLFGGQLEHLSGNRLNHPSVSEILEMFNSLSQREVQVMELLVDGLSNKQMARALGISPKTVEVYRSRLNEKMQARSIAELVRRAIVCGVGRFTEGIVLIAVPAKLPDGPSLAHCDSGPSSPRGRQSAGWPG